MLYDVSSSYMEGRCCPLAKRGYSRDGKSSSLQIVYRLLCAPDGCPVAIEVFDGNTGDPTTLAPQIDKLKQRLGLSHVVLVGDRGMIRPRSGLMCRKASAALTEARITEDIKASGLNWITALREPAIKDLLNSGTVQLTLFDQRDMASITSPDYPGERLVVCRNPDLAAERGRKREELLAATETDLARIKVAVDRKHNPLHGTAEIALAVGAVLNTYKMKKHFTLQIIGDAFSFARQTAGIGMAGEGHVLLCVLAYYLEWHMRQSLAPMLFDDADKQAAETLRSNVVAQAQRSKAALKKQTTGMTPDGLSVHSFRTLLADLATMASNTVLTAINPLYPLTAVTRPMPVQQKAFDLLGLAM